MAFKTSLSLDTIFRYILLQKNEAFASEYKCPDRTSSLSYSGFSTMFSMQGH